MSGTDVGAIRGLQQSLNASIDDYVNASARDGATVGAASQRIAAYASKLVSTTTSPVLANFILGLQHHVFTVVRVAVDLDLFNVVSDQPTTISTIATQTGADSVLILRMTRVLAAFDYLEEVSKGCFQSTPLSRSLRAEPIAAWIKHCFDTGLSIDSKIPSFLKETGYRNPDLTASTTKFATGKKFWDYLASLPGGRADFNNAMRIQEMTPRSSVPVFPFSEQVGPVMALDAATLVDVAGGQGQYLETVAKANPGLKGRLILQDLPDVVAGVDQSQYGFEVMAYDFFTPQPILHARFYHLRRVLHDWPDAESRSILLSQALAFKRGYSRLLINEHVLPDIGVGQLEALTDMTMMFKVSGMERSLSQWESLLESAGFRIVKVWPPETGTHSVIEAELMDG